MVRSDFAAFIITFNRTDILQNTIKQICEQTVLPAKIFIVNNGEQLAYSLICTVAGVELEEHRIGFNSGPAGAANFAMRELAARGFKWIQWIDDDDPPKIIDLNERLFTHLGKTELSNVGIIAAVGAYFDTNTGIAIRVPNAEIENNRYLQVQTVGGNQCMLINTDVIRIGCLPTPSLFFGFEETNFCLKVIGAGFKIIVPCDLFFQYRNLSGRWDLKKQGATKFVNLPWRNYYSIRNLIYMFMYEFKRPKVVLNIITAAGMRAVYSFFKHGPSWGFKDVYYTFLGVRDGFQKKLGLTVKPKSKY